MYQDLVKNGQPVKLELAAGNYAYFQVVEQWNAMLADHEAKTWGTPVILRLLSFVDGLDDKDDTMAVYSTP